jgi:hypothetical protein
MWSRVKTEFNFFLKLKIKKIFVFEYFHVFLKLHVYDYDNKTLTVHRKYQKYSKYVESFGVSTTVFELEAF